MERIPALLYFGQKSVVQLLRMPGLRAAGVAAALALCSCSSEPLIHNPNNIESLQQEEQLAQLISQYIDQRARTIKNDSDVEEGYAMIAHQHRYDFDILSGSTIAKRENERNAIIQKHVQHIRSGMALLKLGVKLDQARLAVSMALQPTSVYTPNVEAAHRALDRQLRTTLAFFRKSSAVKAADRMRFDQMYAALAHPKPLS